MLRKGRAWRFAVIKFLMRVVGYLIPAGRPGAYWVAASALKRAGKGGTAVVAIGVGRLLQVDLDDPYWARLLMPGYRYEPELERAFQMLVPLHYNLIDGGSNVGYWPVLLSSPEYDIGTVIAVEASPAMCEKLRTNIGINRLPVTVLNAAITGKSGEEVSLEPGTNHSGTHVAELDEDGWERIKTTTLRDIVREKRLMGDPLVVKLDIEGAEVSALEGANGLLDDPGVTVLYEDHGRDPLCSATDWLLTRTKRQVLLLKEDNTIQISTTADLRRHKNDPTRGYNLAAVVPGSRAALLLAGQGGARYS